MSPLTASYGALVAVCDVVPTAVTDRDVKDAGSELRGYGCVVALPS